MLSSHETGHVGISNGSLHVGDNERAASLNKTAQHAVDVRDMIPNERRDEDGRLSEDGVYHSHFSNGIGSGDSTSEAMVVTQYRPVMPGDELMYEPPSSIEYGDMSELALDTDFDNDANDADDDAGDDLGDEFKDNAVDNATYPLSHSRRQLGCGVSATDCCSKRLCARSPLPVSGSLRLQVTSSSIMVNMKARIQLSSPGNGLASIDQTLSSTLAVSYGERTSLCDLIPGLKDKLIGSVGGGSTKLCVTVLRKKRCKTFNFPSSGGIRLYNILPCNRLSI